MTKRGPVMIHKILKKDLKKYRAKDLMTRHVITLRPSDNLLSAQNMMSRYRIKKIVIVENSNAVGILTIKDITKFLVSDKTDREMHEIPIDEAMTKPLVTTCKNSSAINCAKVADSKHLSSLIVVEDSTQKASANVLSGIITSTDFAEFFSEACIGRATVEQYMSYPIFTIAINEKVTRAAQLMVEKNISRLVVTAPDRRNGLLGVLSETDILKVTLALKSKTIRLVYENIGLIFGSSAKSLNSIEPALVRIEDIFTPRPTIIEMGADLADAAKVMTRQEISGMPVVKSMDEDVKNQPIGIISNSDIVRAVAQIE